MNRLRLHNNHRLQTRVREAKLLKLYSNICTTSISRESFVQNILSSIHFVLFKTFDFANISFDSSIKFCLFILLFNFFLEVSFGLFMDEVGLHKSGSCTGGFKGQKYEPPRIWVSAHSTQKYKLKTTETMTVIMKTVQCNAPIENIVCFFFFYKIS